ncbi:acid phosphatase 1-like [Salvia miltiorrhiza]|uniref:acid phosphatase 1-like n=1 Tax=Salvia miltiorrhiza TaxID=226208 RepID=UPI0025ABC368|nr:acid phosphatase 1-like [Salvia miltiorrhiza]
MGLQIFLFLATLLFLSHAQSDVVVSSILQLRPPSGTGGHRVDGVNCMSWRLAVETNNLQGWKLVPMSCETYVGNYMLGMQYRLDCEAVADAAIEYAKTVKPAADGKDVWVFDIDETTLSNLPYYARSDVLFGAIAYNSTRFNEWVAEGKAPAVPGIQRLYLAVQSLGFGTVFLSGTGEKFTDIRTSNLQESGYNNWKKLTLKGEDEHGMPALLYKSQKRTELVNEGYRIVGNVGDQWSDLLGANVGNRTFKVPDPMYYVA